jgi:hypothetical protein
MATIATLSAFIVVPAYLVFQTLRALSAPRPIPIKVRVERGRR